MSQQTPTVDLAAVHAFAGRVVNDLAVAATLSVTVLGIRLGLWSALAGAGPLTAGELATRCDLPQPFVREWLRTQAAAGYLDYDPPTDRFTLPAAAAAVLTDPIQVGLVHGLAGQLWTWYADLPALQQGLQTGQGLGWELRSKANAECLDEVSRNAVAPALIGAWLPALQIADRLRTGARVADMGCGFGAQALAVAQAYPATTVVGFDSDQESIIRARQAAQDAGLADRVEFEIATAEQFPGSGFDLITYVDSFHDLADPVGSLTRAGRALAPGGVVLLIEPAAGDRVEDNFNPVGRLFYAASTLVCTPHALAQSGPAAGALLGPARLAGLIAEAGFSQVRRLPVPAPLSLLLECSL